MASVLTPGKSYAMTNGARLALSLGADSAGAFVICTDTATRFQWTGSGWALQNAVPIGELQTVQGPQGPAGVFPTPTYGELTITGNVSATSLPSQNTWVQVTGGSIWSLGDDFSQMAGGLPAGTLTASNPASVVVLSILSFSVIPGNNGVTFQVGIFKNGSLITEHVAQFIAATTDEYMGTVSGIDMCANGDVFDVRVRYVNVHAATTLTMTRANFSIFS